MYACMYNAMHMHTDILSITYSLSQSYWTTKYFFCVFTNELVQLLDPIRSMIYITSMMYYLSKHMCSFIGYYLPSTHDLTLYCMSIMIKQRRSTNVQR